MPVGIKDREQLLAYKKAEHEEKGIAFDGSELLSIPLALPLA